MMSDASIDDLIRLTFSMTRILRRRMAETGGGKESVKNWLQLHALAFIEDHPGVTMKELAASLMVTAPTATTFIERLVKLGCVRRLADPKNRKLVRLRVTAKGRLLIGQAMERKMSVLQTILRHLSERDRRELARIYQKLIDRCSPPAL